MNRLEENNLPDQEQRKRDELNKLLRKFQQQAKAHRFSRFLGNGFIVLLFTGAGLFLLSFFLKDMGVDIRPVANVACVVGGICFAVFYLPALIVPEALKTVKWQDMDWQQFDNAAAVGPLLEALDIGDARIQPVVQNALVNLLPRLQAGDAALLTPWQWKCLYRALSEELAPAPASAPLRFLFGSVLRQTSGQRLIRKRPTSHKLLVLAILKALEQIGNLDALPVVESVAEGGSDRDIREAATACLPFLQTRLAIQKQETVLLRPSQPETTGPDQLLHPAQSPSQTSPDQLLRSTSLHDSDRSDL